MSALLEGKDKILYEDFDTKYNVSNKVCIKNSKCDYVFLHECLLSTYEITFFNGNTAAKSRNHSCTHTAYHVSRKDRHQFHLCVNGFVLLGGTAYKCDNSIANARTFEVFASLDQTFSTECSS